MSNLTNEIISFLLVAGMGGSALYMIYLVVKLFIIDRKLQRVNKEIDRMKNGRVKNDL